jgi:O-acetyl-ADP-ribose deacetylase (regulator of RNase III)
VAAGRAVTMDNAIFVVHGDLTQLAAHAITYSASTYLGPDGDLYSGYRAHVPTFAEQFAALPRPAESGAAFWLPLAREARPHGVVVVVAAGGEGTQAEKRRRAVEAAIDTAVRHLRELGLRERLLLALPAFRLGQGGDKRFALDSACGQVEAAHDVLDRHEGVDVVFVTYTPAVYQVFLEARRKVLGQPFALPATLPSGLADEIYRGECVLFVGAGVSQGAGLPAWDDLIRQLAGELDVEVPAKPPLDFYLDLAQWYAERFTHDALADVIRRTYGDTRATARPTLAHYFLTGLPVRYHVTTNYDDLLERALEALRRYPIKVVRQQEVARTGRSDAVYVVKLHGDAGTPEEPIVLSRDDYDAFFDRRPAMAALLEGLLLNRTFLFVGYSLRDPNFRQIYHRIARMLRGAQRPAYAISFDAAGGAGEYLAEQWRRKGLHLIRIPGASFAEQNHAYLRLLDQAAEQVSRRAPRLFLADDAAAPPRLEPLRALLRDGLGAEVEEACRHELSPGEAAHVAQVLEFLTQAGWRPRHNASMPLWKLWESLADQAGDAEIRRGLLITALRHTERFSAATHLRAKLDELRGGTRSGGASA